MGKNKLRIGLTGLLIITLLGGCAWTQANLNTPDQKVALYEEIAPFFADARVGIVGLQSSGKCSQQDLANIKLGYNKACLIFWAGGDALTSAISGKLTVTWSSSSIHSLIQTAAQLVIESSDLPPGALAQGMAIVSAVATQLEIQFAKIDQVQLSAMTDDQRAALVNRISNSRMLVQGID